jgi:hypothetical protein
MGWSGNKKITSLYYFYLSLENGNRDQKANHLATIFNIRRSLDWYLTTLGLKTTDEKMPDDEKELEGYIAKRLKTPENLESFSVAYDGFDQEACDEVVMRCDETISAFAEKERYDCMVEQMDELSTV